MLKVLNFTGKAKNKGVKMIGEGNIN